MSGMRGGRRGIGERQDDRGVIDCVPVFDVLHSDGVPDSGTYGCDYYADTRDGCCTVDNVGDDCTTTWGDGRKRLANAGVVLRSRYLRGADAVPIAVRDAVDERDCY